jgi:two-component system, chemotaxis family, chemotaxis protein CheY
MVAAQGVRILVIEDNEALRRTIVRTLTDLGHEVREAPDGSVGIRLFRENQVDLVITDLFMPEKEGLETIMELKHSFPCIKILAISGEDRFGEKNGYLRVAQLLGARVTLEKPFNREELLNAVKAALES